MTFRLQKQRRSTYPCFPDMNTMNASFLDLIFSFKRSFISANDMSFANDTIRLPVKPMNGHNETNSSIKSIIKQKK